MARTVESERTGRIQFSAVQCMSLYPRLYTVSLLSVLLNVDSLWRHLVFARRHVHFLHKYIVSYILRAIYTLRTWLWISSGRKLTTG